MNSVGIAAVAKSIRSLSMDAIQKANSGHPGLPMGAAEAAAVLYGEVLKHNPANSKWVDRDRFVLSAGHGSMLLYSILHIAGYKVSMDDIKSFRQVGSKCPVTRNTVIQTALSVQVARLVRAFQWLSVWQSLSQCLLPDSTLQITKS